MGGRTVIMPSETTTSIHQHCSVCKADFDMDVIKQGSTEDVLWLKCPGCQGFLPYMPKEDLTDVERMPDEQKVALEDLDVEHAKEYDDKLEYQIGEILHHRSWNDFGKVVAKDEASYRYLAESIRRFPDQPTLLSMMQDAGLENCRYHNLSGGIVALHRGYRL